MLVGCTIFKLGGDPFYSPPFPRGGMAARFAAQVSSVVNAPNFTITIQHKNIEDSSFVDAGAFAVITANGEYSRDLSGLKEIVRFKYTFGAGDVSDAGVHVLMQAPSWRPY
jgi:hypothetical protein